MPRSLPFIHAAEEIGDALTERLAPILASADLTPAQFNVLYMLVEDGPMTLGELAKFQRCVKSNISYITRTMERDGLVHLAASESDQRARVISASKLGIQRFDVAKAAAQKVETALRRALGANVLERIAQGCLEAAAALDRSA
jgi:DNA-binding MarR family transcriptional regulator